MKRDIKKDRRKKRTFRMAYERFREILSINEALHRLIVECEDQRGTAGPLGLEQTILAIRRGFLDALIMVKDLDQIAHNRYASLYDTVMDLHSRFEREVANAAPAVSGPLILPIEKLRAECNLQAGAKMTHLGEIRNVLGLAVPPGFALTVAASNLFMTENGLWQRASQLSRLGESEGMAALTRASREVQEAILAAPLPPELENELFRHFQQLAAGEEIRVAMRSSAVGEDLAASHAGQYYTELNVSRAGLADAYRMVLASTYKPSAISYRRERNLPESEAAMAVGCLRMVHPRVAGVIFSRDFRDPAADRIELAFTCGLADKLVQGEKNTLQLDSQSGHLDPGVARLLSPAELTRLRDAARRMEAHFGKPQDVEWAIDQAGQLFILQSRQMAKAPAAGKVADDAMHGIKPLLAGGQVACPGAAAGPVAPLDPESLESFPAGAVAVARYASPHFSRIMNRAAALLTEIGSPISHMAILSREFGLPCIVGLPGVTRLLVAGQVVTVDATRGLVFAGELAIEKAEKETPQAACEPGPAGDALRRINHLITPLNLLDPADPGFTPQGCKSLHDLTRFVHEKLYETMFALSDRASALSPETHTLEMDLPMEVRIFDVGGGLAADNVSGGRLRPEAVVSLPLLAMLRGLQDPRIDWRKPRAVSARGFLSVMGESMLAPPPQPDDMGAASFVIVADCYLNFSIKVGYHFSVIDAFASANPHQNYINLRFAGGGAGDERRQRRLRFLDTVLAGLDFQVYIQGDLLIARFDKFDQAATLDRLADLGRLTLCARQLDMLMDSEETPRFFSEAFQKGEFDKF